MTGSALRRRLKIEYDKQEGVRFFSEKALLFALLEKRGLPRDYLILEGERELPVAFCRSFLADAAALLAGEPLQYYIGTAPFFGYEFETAPGVLIPRTDTEVLVREAARIAPVGARFFDFCCGSGCVGLALLLARSDLSAVLFDLSGDALALSRRNTARHALTDRVSVEKLDVLSDAAREAVMECRPALILANPPYLTAEEMRALPENVKREPPLALAGGEDGLLFYRAFASLTRETGVPILAEIGFAQAEPVFAILRENDLTGTLFRDEGGRDRAVLICSQ
ncbi:MAG: peptide chain release factor N(5)-glutamine methyltransferase [Clostridia bacterium]|nr:peptide chain release factor N(5)-glutamine methyltransferase [Clostridia bacterium]